METLGPTGSLVYHSAVKFAVHIKQRETSSGDAIKTLA